ncbi:GFA family protein [Sphingopyxis sp. KK2]|uniref:GFA family protein n=1 Tax=Sphingopyxis sp. KK2 TaxID=1855727 RepID=UPI00097E6C03|nr:GFA family protein [Sphingopyxis sp. KK2]
MTGSTRGACLCGAVRFEISGGFDAFFLCHCSRCRKDSGSAHAANLFSASATIAWLTGKERVKSYRLPGSRHERSFCRECGSALPGIQMDGALLVVPAGSLDDPIAIRPTAHISCASRADWDVGLELVPALDGLPG